MGRLSATDERLRRAAILDAAIVELAANGPAGLATARVAGRSGTAPTAVHGRYPTKDRLVAAVVEERVAPALHAWIRDAAAVPSDGPPPVPPLPSRPVVDAWQQVLAAAAADTRWRAPAARLLRPLIPTAPPTTPRRGAPPARPVTLAWLVGWHTGAWLLRRGAGRRLPTALARRLHQEAGGATPGEAPPVAPAALRRDGTAAPPGPTGDLSRHGPSTAPLPLDELGHRLVEATVRCTARGGFEGAPVAVIARAAGTTTSAVYNRFSGKYGLLAEAVQRTAPPACEPRASAGDLGAEAGAAVWAEALRLAPADPELAGAVRREVTAALDRRREELSALQRTGRLRPDLAPARLAAVLLAADLGDDVLTRASGHHLDLGPAHHAVHAVLRTGSGPARGGG